MKDLKAEKVKTPMDDRRQAIYDKKRALIKKYMDKQADLVEEISYIRTKIEKIEGEMSFSHSQLLHDDQEMIEQSNRITEALESLIQH